MAPMDDAAKRILRDLSTSLVDMGFDFSDGIREGIAAGDTPIRILNALDKDVEYGWEQVGDPEDRPTFTKAHGLIKDAADQVLALRRR